MAENKQDALPAQDEFDNPPTGPIGLHRGQRSWISRLLPYLVTLLVAVLLAAGTWLWMSGKGRELFSGLTSSTSQTTKTTTSTKKSTTDSESKKSDSDDTDSDSSASDSDKKSSDSSDSKKDTSDTESSKEQSGTVDKSKSVIIYNGLTTRVSGFAAGKASTLQSAGYTSVSAKNPSGSTPSANVVWYKTSADKATAQDVASKLGISNVTQAASISADVAVMYITQ
jgi:cytoskeletal protein RodZ